MPTLRLVQEAIDPSGTHRVAVELQEDGSRWSATAKVDLDLDRAELVRLRWYLEDYLEYPIDPAPRSPPRSSSGSWNLAGTYSARSSRSARRPGCGIGPSPGRTSARRTGVHLGIIGPLCADGANRPKPG